MTRLKLLYYAQESAVRKCHSYNKTANDFKGDVIGEMAREIANRIMSDIKEIEAMIVDEEERLRAEAKKQRKQEQTTKTPQAQPKAQQAQQECPTTGRIVDDGMKWTVAIRYKDGSETVSRFSNEDVARKAYETVRMLDKGIAKSNLSRMTLTHKNTVVKAYERD